LIIDLLDDLEPEVIKEASWCINNICEGGTPDHLTECTSHLCIERLCDALHSQDHKVLDSVLKCLGTILKKARKMFEDKPSENPFLSAIEHCEGLDTIEELQTSKNVDVESTATFIMKEYFQDYQTDNISYDEDNIDNDNNDDNAEYNF
jgi:hypothetical protein